MEEIDKFHMDRQILSLNQCVERFGEEEGGRVWDNFVRYMEYNDRDVHMIKQDSDGQA